jgi:hypothetical protein
MREFFAALGGSRHGGQPTDIFVDICWNKMLEVFINQQTQVMITLL